jgi:chromosome segregation ATPase
MMIDAFQDDFLFLRFRLGELESELTAKEEERKGFMQCFEKLESEKLNLANKLSVIEKDLENIRKERDELKTSLGLSNDTLDALRQSKRLVENKFQNVVEMSEKQSREIESQCREIETMLVQKLSLEEQLSHRNANLEAMQQELVTLFYLSSKTTT